MAAVVGIAYGDLQSSLKSLNVNNLLSTDRPTAAGEKPPEDSFAGRAFNVLIIGEDERPAGSRDEHGDLVTGMRSDTTMLAHVSKDRSRIDIVSIPRDLLVDIPACNLPNGKTLRPQRGQFNWAFAYGADGGGMEAAVACSIKTTEKLSDVYIDEFVVLNFDGFQNIINALGGIEMCPEEPVVDKWTGLNLPAGCQRLDGKTALDYARARHVKGTDGSDTGRIGRQQLLVGSVVREAFSKNLLTDLSALYSFARAGLQSIYTSPNLGSLMTLGGLATSLVSIDKANIKFVTLPTTAAPNDRNRLVVTDDTALVWESFIEDKPLPDTIYTVDANGLIHDPNKPTDTPTPTTSESTTSKTPEGSNN